MVWKCPLLRRKHGADGLGYQSVVAGETDEFSCMDLTDLAAKIEQCNANGEQILAIVATVGTTDAGAIDPLRAIAELAAETEYLGAR